MSVFYFILTFWFEFVWILHGNTKVLFRGSTYCTMSINSLKYKKGNERILNVIQSFFLVNFIILNVILKYEYDTCASNQSYKRV